MNITSILILKPKFGPDKIIFYTNIKSAQWPFKGTQDLYTDVAQGHGEEFCEENFPKIPYTVKEI